MSGTEKPSLSLPALTGDVPNDMAMLVALYEKLTGKKPTAEELAEALEAMRREPT